MDPPPLPAPKKTSNVSLLTVHIAGMLHYNPHTTKPKLATFRAVLKSSTSLSHWVVWRQNCEAFACRILVSVSSFF